MANLDKSIDMIEQLLVEVSDDQFDEIIKDVPHVPGLEILRHATMHGAEKIELHEIPKPVEAPEVGGVVDAVAVEVPA